MPLIHDYTPNSTLIVRLISTAQTGFFYTTQRLRTGPKLAAVKYDPRGTSLSPHNVTSSFCPVLSLSLSCLVPPNRRYHLTQGSQRPFVHPPLPLYPRERARAYRRHAHVSIHFVLFWKGVGCGVHVRAFHPVHIAFLLT